MKKIKTLLISSLTVCASCLMLAGCGSSKEEAKDATPQSAESSSSEKEQSSSKSEGKEASISSPFNQNRPIYVTDNDDSNMRVDAIITPYLDTKDKVKIETYEDGEVKKTYIADFRNKAIVKDEPNAKTQPLYHYNFYNDGVERNYDATLIKAKDMNNEIFIVLYPLEDSYHEPINKGGKDFSIKEIIKKNNNNDYRVYLTDNPDVVTFK